jgi:hypothetical protein
MHRTILFSALLSMGVAWAEGSPSASYTARAPVEQYRMSTVQDEIALARSAAPPSISAHAEVLVLGPHGYEKAVAGSNGFVCLVERSWDAGFAEPEFWNPKIRGPDCFNPPAARSVLPRFLQRTEWALAGVGKAEMMHKTRAALASHALIDPAPGSVCFMLSKQGYLGDQAGGPWLPHVMFFVPHGQAAVWAAGLEGSPVVGSEGDAIEPTVLYVPVRRWSDGSPAPPPSTPHQHTG